MYLQDNQYLAHPGKARGCSTNTSVIQAFSHSVMVCEHMFTAPPRPKIYCITISREILHLEGHPNRIAGSKATAILLNGWTLPIGGACE